MLISIRGEEQYLRAGLSRIAKESGWLMSILSRRKWGTAERSDRRRRSSLMVVCAVGMTGDCLQDLNGIVQSPV